MKPIRKGISGQFCGLPAKPPNNENPSLRVPSPQRDCVYRNRSREVWPKINTRRVSTSDFSPTSSSSTSWPVATDDTSSRSINTAAGRQIPSANNVLVYFCKWVALVAAAAHYGHNNNIPYQSSHWWVFNLQSTTQAARRLGFFYNSIKLLGSNQRHHRATKCTAIKTNNMSRGIVEKFIVHERL